MSAYQIAPAYKGLRDQIFNLNPVEAGFTPTKTLSIWGLLMETAAQGVIVTLVAIMDGTVSLYFSNGGGILGMGVHDGPREANESLLTLAHQFLNQARPTQTFDYPEDGFTRFYFLTFNGVLVAEAKEDDLGNKRVPLSPLFHEAHNVIHEVRMIDQQPVLVLIRAAATGHLQEVKRMLQMHVDVNRGDPSGVTALMAAAHEGQSASVRLLLESGCLVDAQDKNGNTALILACNLGQIECVQLLLKHGAGVNQGDNNGSTPLMFAAQRGNNDIIRLLLAGGADPNLKAKHGLSALDIAKRNGLQETEQILLREI
ncbi:MAG: ankyrin repeat domain-containing protein [Chloroflexota bacterium]